MASRLYTSVEGLLKWEGKNGDLGAVPPVGSRSKATGGGRSGAPSPEANDTFVKMCYFVTVVSVTAITVQYKMEEKSIWSQKW